MIETKNRIVRYKHQNSKGKKLEIHKLWDIVKKSEFWVYLAILIYLYIVAVFSFICSYFGEKTLRYKFIYL